ncbi:MAG: hypothetical protein ACFFB5_14595 [Promethearchaeota archaeon]
MLGVNITTKNGLLLFSHFFVAGFSDVDEDLRAGLMTAVLNAVKKTHNNSSIDTSIKTIDQGRYFVHIVEGVFTYGLFFSHENDLKENTFANTTLQKFESMFEQNLNENISFDEKEFTIFSDYLKKEYNALISIDVVGLSKIIEIMEESFFSNYIILEKPNLHQVFTTVSLPAIYPYTNQLVLMCKNILEASFKIKNEISEIKFNLGENIYIFVHSLRKYVVIIIVEKKDHDKAIKEIVRIHNKIELYFF